MNPNAMNSLRFWKPVKFNASCASLFQEHYNLDSFKLSGLVLSEQIQFCLVVFLIFPG